MGAAAASTRVVHARDYRPARAWDALELLRVDGVAARLQWTDAEQRWQTCAEDQIVAVLEGLVDMHYRCNGEDRFVTLGAGDVFVAAAGCERLARPRGEAHVLVIERVPGAERGERAPQPRARRLPAPAVRANGSR